MLKRRKSEDCIFDFFSCQLEHYVSLFIEYNVTMLQWYINNPFQVWCFQWQKEERPKMAEKVILSKTELMREQCEKYLWNPRMHQDTPHGQSEYLIKIIWIAKTQTVCEFVWTNGFKNLPFDILSKDTQFLLFFVLDVVVFFE